RRSSTHSGIDGHRPARLSLHMKSAVEQSAYLLALAEPSLAGLDDSHRALEPVPSGKTAGWLVGHPAGLPDYAPRLCRTAPPWPHTWNAACAPGSQPPLQSQDDPSMPELIATFFAAHRDLGDAALAATPETLAASNPFVPALDATRRDRPRG